MKKSMLAFALALAMTLASCSTGGGASSDAKSSEAHESEKSSQAAESDEAEESEESKESSEKDETETTAFGDVTLRYMTGSDGTLLQAEQKVIDGFTADTGVKVEVTSVSGVAEFMTALKAKFAAGEEPDVYQFQGGNRVKEFAKAGLLYDITDEKFMDRINEIDKPFNSFDGRIYGAPVDQQVTGLFVNNAVLEQYDDINIPDCFPELLAENQKLRDQGMEFPQLIAGKDINNVSQFDFQYLATVVLYNHPTYYEEMLSGERHFDDPFIVEMFDRFSELREYMSPDSLGVDNDEAIKRFIRGDCAFWIAHGSTVTRIREIDPELDFVIVPSVLQDKPEDRVLNSGITNAISIVASSEHIDETIAFVDRYLSKESSEMLVNEGGIISATKDVDIMPDRCLDPMLDWLDSEKKVGHADLVWVPGIKDTMKEVTQKWFMGEPLESILDEWESQHQRLLAADPTFVENYGKE